MMPQDWFSPDGAFYFAGASLLCLTALAAPAIAKGRRKTLVFAIWGVIIGLGSVLLAAGAIAVYAQQPFHVVLPLLLTGGIMTAGYGISLAFVLRAYRLAEYRKVAAREL